MDNYLRHQKGLDAQSAAQNLIVRIRQFGSETYGESWRLSSRNLDQIAQELIRFYEAGKADASSPR